MRQRGVKPVRCNAYLRALNAFCKWLHQEGHAEVRARLPPLKVKKRLLETHNERVLRAILGYRFMESSMA